MALERAATGGTTQEFTCLSGLIPDRSCGFQKKQIDSERSFGMAESEQSTHLNGSQTAADGRNRFSHLDTAGNARMVNVAEKPVTVRRASAGTVCEMDLPTADSIRAGQIGKGDVLQVARIAAIAASKRTDELIPLCHSLGLDSVEVDFEWLDSCRLQITVHVQATARTGVEMEAMVAASVGALTVYDMCKSSDRAIRITDLRLLSKSGGVRGDYKCNEEA